MSLFACMKTVPATQDTVFVWHLYQTALSLCPGKQLAGLVPWASSKHGAACWHSKRNESLIRKSMCCYDLIHNIWQCLLFWERFQIASAYWKLFSPQHGNFMQSFNDKTFTVFLEDMKSVFLQWFPFSLRLHYSQWLFFICHFSSQSFSSLFKILHSHKSQSSTHDTYLLSSSLSPILSPCWNLLRCNCHYEWWSVSVRVCLIAHLYTHIFFPTQTQIHTHTHTSSDMYYVMCAHRICTHRYIYRHTHFYAHLCDK